MKLHKFELYLYDFDDVGAKRLMDLVTNARGIAGRVAHSETVEIEWSDDHELNKWTATREDFLRYFIRD